MKDVITKKIIELGEESKLCNEPNAAIVLFALAGSMKGELDYILAEKVQAFIKDVMLPNLQSKIAFRKISDN